MEVQPIVAILALVVAAGIGGIIGAGFGGAMSESARSEERAAGYRDGYNRAAAVDQEHESFEEKP